MPTTTNYDFYSPPLTGVTPNVPRELKTLADAVDVALKAEETARIAADTAIIPFGSQRNSGTQSIPNTTHTKVTTMSTNDGGLRGGMAWTNNGFVIPKAGVYSVAARASWTSNATGSRLIYVYKNGAAVATWGLPAPSAAPMTVGGSLLMYCEATDVLELYVYQSSGGALNIINNAGDTGFSAAFQGL